MLRAIIVAAAIAGAGCVNAPAYVRSGEVLARDEIALRMTWAVPLAVPGRFDSERGVMHARGLGRRFGQSWRLNAIASLVPTFEVEVGVGDRGELDVVLGAAAFGIASAVH